MDFEGFVWAYQFLEAFSGKIICLLIISVFLLYSIKLIELSWIVQFLYYIKIYANRMLWGVRFYLIDYYYYYYNNMSRVVS